MLFCMILSALFGFSLVQFLTCHPVSMSFHLLLTCLAGFVLLAALYRLKEDNQLLWQVATLCTIVFACSYLAALYTFMNVTEDGRLPAITRAKGDLGLGHTAVIILAHGEPETYDPSAWIKQMKELDEKKTPFIPYPLRPLFFNVLRQKYLQAGKSEHNLECLQIMKEIEEKYRRRGDKRTRFYMSYLESAPNPDAAVIRALNEGASSIILCNIFITISSHTQEAVDQIDPIGLADYGVTIKYTKPLYDSKSLQQLYVDEVKHHAVALDKEKVGVILVGHGQPLDWDKEFYSQTQQEISFRQDIFKLLAQDGYPSENLKLAWMEFREPKPEQAIKQLLGTGATDIFYFSTIIGKGSIHVKYDVPESMNKAKLPNTVKLKQLSAFNQYHGIVDALVERIEECR